ncbi:ArsR/SmtB family transcription factor [Brevibacterium album]|uniref:ArsR/SmtB family transcription factor n=1 Tax=Brevibacterium album TaxID=417948 RepID=UPI00040F67C8|nr:metalloregulator ArsR/SmtB family transcription factor [Brevibacterium album]
MVAYAHGASSPTDRAEVPALTDEQVDRIFRALADATRRDIVRRTLSAPANVSALAADYEMSFAAVQKHVRVLEGAGLVRKEQQGRERVVHGVPRTISGIQDLLGAYAEIWRGRITRLDALFDEEQSA